MALCQLGFDCVHYPATIETIRNYDAACEVRFRYQDLENLFPDSLYVYTRRDFDDWFQSCQRHKKHWKPEWNPFWVNHWEEEYVKKEKSLDFFKDKRERLLILDVFAGDGWNELCPFVDKNIPEFDYPHLNSSKEAKNVEEKK